MVQIRVVHLGGFSLKIGSTASQEVVSKLEIEGSEIQTAPLGGKGPHGHLSHEKNPALLSMKYWLFNRDPCNGL